MDICRDSFFNRLNSFFYLENLTFLDLFSGTGMMSYEAASRGFKQITAVEMDVKCTRFISEQFKVLKIDNAWVFRGDVIEFLRQVNQTFNVIYADPPYRYPHYAEMINIIFNKKIIASEGLLAVEHGKEQDFSGIDRFYEMKKYGQSIISYFINK